MPPTGVAPRAGRATRPTPETRQPCTEHRPPVTGPIESMRVVVSVVRNCIPRASSLSQWATPVVLEGIVRTRVDLLEATSPVPCRPPCSKGPRSALLPTGRQRNVWEAKSLVPGRGKRTTYARLRLRAPPACLALHEPWDGIHRISLLVESVASLPAPSHLTQCYLAMMVATLLSIADFLATDSDCRLVRSQTKEKLISING